MILTALTALEAWRVMPEQCRTPEMLASLELFSYPMVIQVDNESLTAGAAA